MIKQKKPLVSVIIATKNEAPNIRRCLTSIRKQTYPNIEIIVVDNFSTDATAALAKLFTPYVFIHGPERSFQRNFGAKRSRGQYLLFLDADMELPPVIISQCVRAIRNKIVAAVIIPEDTPGETLFARIKRLEKRLYWGESLIEAARFFRTNDYLAIGGYNNKLIAGEDWDLSQRIQALGKITRITTPLYHHETSILHELRHKLYYAQKMTLYEKLYPESFRRQSGIARLRLFWRKRHQLFTDPLATSGLLLLKGLEYCLYLTVTVYNQLRHK